MLVGYDLNSPGKDYKPLIERLKMFGSWWHNLDSTWLVKTTMTVTQVRDTLRPLMDTNDELLVLDVTGRAAAWTGFRASAGQWIKDNV
jgi:hypothetical protein